MRATRTGPFMEKPTSLPIAIMICSDVAKISFVKKTLKGTYYVMDARDTISAIEWMKSSPVEIILLDFNTLDEPLFNVCDHIRKLSGLKTTPILLITSKIQKAFTLEAIKAGVTDILHEPLDASEIFEKIASNLKSKLVSKKLSFVTHKIKNAPLIAKNTKILSHKQLLNDQTIKKIASAKEMAPPLSMVMIELDSIDTLSHLWGDAALDEILRFLKSFLEKKLRTNDSMIVQGGGRFLLLMPKTSQSAAKIIAEDIRKEICRTTISTQKKEFIVSVSIGLVCFDKKPTDSAQAYEQFDKSLSRVNKALEKARKKGNTTISDQ